MDAKKHMMVGRTILAVHIAADGCAIKFDTDTGEVIARTYGDCCSHTWIESVENTVREFPALVTDAGDVEDGLPESTSDHPEHYYLQFYGFKLMTDKGVMVIDYRNSSNGYYGGSLDWPGDSYYYGGVYGQNVSKEEWKPLP